MIYKRTVARLIEQTLTASIMFTSCLVLGGARSGKSRRALTLAEKIHPQRVMIATAQPYDVEMTDRIARHKAERGPGWALREVPLDLSEAIEGIGQQRGVCLVDCLTLWLSNSLLDDRDIERETETLCQAISSAHVPIILVSNEVGMGLVPETALSRRFRDAQGRLNQTVAAVCDTVEFVAAGLPVSLKNLQ